VCEGVGLESTACLPVVACAERWCRCINNYMDAVLHVLDILCKSSEAYDRSCITRVEVSFAQPHITQSKGYTQRKRFC